MKTMTIGLKPREAINLLRTLENDTPFSMVVRGALEQQITLEVWADGSPTAHTLTLCCDGKWELNTEVPV